MQTKAVNGLGPLTSTSLVIYGGRKETRMSTLKVLARAHQFAVENQKRREEQLVRVPAALMRVIRQRLESAAVSGHPGGTGFRAI